MRHVRSGDASAAIIIVFATAYLVLTTAIPVPPTYFVVGPRAFPSIIGVGMLICGLWLFVEGRTGARRTPAAPVDEESGEEERGDVAVDWRTLTLVSVTILGYIALLEVIGFIISTAALVWLTAAFMGSKHRVRDGVVAIAAAALLFLLFTRFLGVRLPTGYLGL